MFVVAVEERPRDYVLGPKEIEQTSENLPDVVDLGVYQGEEGSDEDYVEYSDDNAGDGVARRQKSVKKKKPGSNEDEDDEIANMILAKATGAKSKSFNASRFTKQKHDNDLEVRKKVRAAIQQGLDKAAEEIKESDGSYNAALVASFVEDALFKLYGGYIHVNRSVCVSLSVSPGSA